MRSVSSRLCLTLTEAEVLIAQWRAHCNTRRPRISLDCRPPAPHTVAPLWPKEAALEQ